MGAPSSGVVPMMLVEASISRAPVTHIAGRNTAWAIAPSARCRCWRGISVSQTALCALFRAIAPLFLYVLLPACAVAMGAQPSKPSCDYVEPRGATYPLSEPRWCADGKDDAGQPLPLLLTPLPGITRRQIDTRERSLWRYKAAFPLACDEPISLGEGCTPLVRREIAGRAVHFKCEWANPTCSFKDRGTTVMLSLLRAQGVEAVLEDSSGNGGASAACYAAAGGLAATIMAPSSTSPAKTVQMRAHGATVELVPGSRQACADAAVAAHGRDGGGGPKLFTHRTRGTRSSCRAPRRSRTSSGRTSASARPTTS